MFELYSTPLDILYLVLSIIIGLLGIFLSIILFHIIKILRNINKVSAKAKDTMDLVNHYLWQPIKIAMTLMEKSKEMARKKRDRKKS